jgi:glucosylceramidase
MNRSEREHRFTLRIDGLAGVAALPARCIATYLLPR